MGFPHTYMNIYVYTRHDRWLLLAGIGQARKAQSPCQVASQSMFN
jgi:hypothetical protein